MDLSRFAFREEDESENDGKERSTVPVETHRLECKGSGEKLTPPVLSDLFKSPGQSSERALRVVIIGFCASDASRAAGHYYAHPGNRMWTLLRESARIVGRDAAPQRDAQCPQRYGVGFADLLRDTRERDSSSCGEIELRAARLSLYARIVAHAQRVADESESESGVSLSLCDAAPRVLAFNGVRQWKALFPATHAVQRLAVARQRKREREVDADKAPERKEQKQTSMRLFARGKREIETERTTERETDCLRHGLQALRPPDWPAPLSRCLVFLLPSSSGAAAMSNAEREEPYAALGELVRELDHDGCLVARESDDRESQRERDEARQREKVEEVIDLVSD